MPKPKDLAQLNRHVLLSKLASLGVLLFGLIGFILYIKPSLIGVASESRGEYQGEVVWLLMAMILVPAGFVFLFISTRWPRQLKNTVLRTLPIPMTVGLEVEEGSDSITYYAVLSERGDQTGRTPVWRAHIWVHPPEVRKDIGQQFEGQVFFHPETGCPVAIEYSRGVLWVIAGSAAVKRLFPDRQPI